MAQFQGRKWLSQLKVQHTVKALLNRRLNTLIGKPSAPESSVETQSELDANQQLTSRRRTLVTVFAGLLPGAGSLFTAFIAQAADPGRVRVSKLRLIPTRPVVRKITRITAAIDTSGVGRINIPWTLQMDGKSLTSGIQRNHTAGRPFTVTGAWNATPGQHTVILRVDPANTLKETANLRRDNTRTLRFQVAASGSTKAKVPPPSAATTTAFKVHMTNFRIQPTKPKPGDRCTLIAKITTSGRGITDVPWEILLGNRRIGAGARRQVKAGGVFEVRATWQATTGLHNFLAKVDPRNQKKESSRELMDNARGFSLRVQPVQGGISNSRQTAATPQTQTATTAGNQSADAIRKDLRISRFSIMPESPEEGGSTELRLKIRGPASQELKVKWRIYLNSDIVESGSANLRKGRMNTFRSNWRAKAGIHRFRAVVYPDKPGYGPNWSNNRNISRLTVSVEKPANWSAWSQAALEGSAEAVNFWATRARLSNVKINGPIATGGKLQGPNFINIIRDRIKNSGAPNIVAQKFAEAIWQSWRNWEKGVNVPALPWYPAFAAFPAKNAPPTPNIPSPLLSISAVGNVHMIPSSLKNRIKKRLGNLAKDSLAQAAIVVFANKFAASFTVWQAQAQVMNVTGMGKIPTFAPPFVPVGPVVNGRASSKSGFLAAGPRFIVPIAK